jgi:tetratricopeptide (TPR) repeat protein
MSTTSASFDVNGERLLLRAREAHRSGRFRRVLELTNTGLNARLAGEYWAQLRLIRAQALLELGQPSRAQRDCQSALGASGAEAEVILARCHLAQGRPLEARAALERAFARGEDGAGAWQLSARANGELGEHSAAVAAAEKARSREPSLHTLLTLSEALRAAGRHEERALLLEHALACAGDNAELWTALGLSYYSLGRSEASLSALERAVALAPGSVDAHCGLSWVLLRLGRYEEGFRHQEHRQANVGLDWRLGIPPLRTTPSAGVSVLVCSEQGFGDTIQFARYMPWLRRLGAQTKLLVAKPLVRLLAGNPAVGEVDARQPNFGSADYQALLMSLPHVLGTGANLALDDLPLLRAEPERVAAWRVRLPPGPKVAIAWQGNPKYGGEPFRSMPFHYFEPLLARFRGRVSFISLQKHVGREQLRASSQFEGVVDLGDMIDQEHAFVDSLAIMSQVDHFIGTDSALAHVAGSAAIPGWILLSNVADWRWGCAETRTPWYPSLRLFRQSVPGAWDSLIARVGAELSASL